MRIARAGVAKGVMAISAFALVAASMAPAQAAKKTRDECMQLASQRGFNQVSTKADADAKRAFVVSCMQGKQG
jgi:ABC-type transporter MlaC component